MSLDALVRYAARDYKGLLKNDFDFVYDEIKNFPIQPQDMRALRETIKGREEKTSRKLTRETADLRKRIDELKNAPLFSWQFFEKQDLSGYTFRIWEKLYAAASVLKVPDDAELQNGDFKSIWIKTQRLIKEALANYDAIAAQYRDNGEIAKKAAEIRKMLLANADLVRIVVLDSELKKLPETQTETYGFVEQKAAGESVFDFSGRLAQESIGDLNYAKGYDPAAVKQLLENVFSIAQPYMKNKQFGPQEILPPTFMREYSRYDERLAVFEKYLDAFLRYWGTYPDNVYEPANSWAEFKQRLETLKAFRINSLLQNIYARCLNILKDIDDTFLSDVLKRQKADYAALVNDELNMLTPLFTDAGQKALNAWAELPDDPEQAWNKLTSMSDRELKNSFLNVYTTAPHSKIGWWNGFVENGVDLLRRENEKKLEENFQNILRDMNAFPLCRNCGAKKTVSPLEMRKLTKLLQMTARERTETDDGDAPLFDRNLDLFKEKEKLEWASDILKIADQLTNAKKPLIWSLYQAPVEMQNNLMPVQGVSAVNRFRAVELTTEKGVSGRRFSTAMTTEIKLGQGAASAPVTLNFYKLSGDETPEARIRFADYWAIFRIYLQRGGYQDPNNGRIYVPLTVKDKSGAKFTYFVAVKFNRDVPSPDE